MKFSESVLNGTRNKWLHFGSEMDHCLDHLDPGLAKVCALRVLMFARSQSLIGF